MCVRQTPRLMKSRELIDLDSNIARARIVLSLVTWLSIYVDPTTPAPFSIDSRTLTTLAAHLAYAIATYLAVHRRVAADRLPAISATLDILFAVAVAFCTEGPTSPSFVFFAFAIVAVGCRRGFRATVTVTFLSMSLYLLLIELFAPNARDLYVMRPAYLGITGYLIGFLGQQRVNFEERIRELETRAERHSIARFLHDGYVQGLAGINLRLESSRELLARKKAEEALLELTELQAGVAREFDEARGYIRSLLELESGEKRRATSAALKTQFRVHADFIASALVVEHVLQIMLEGIRNTRRHGNARTASIDAVIRDQVVRITIDDDGVGFQERTKPPWSIASRVAEIGGRFRIVEDQRLGAHLEIEMPTT